MTERANRPGTKYVLLPLFIALSTAPALAEKSEAAVKAEIEFARGLAADWSFVDLAETVLSNAENAGIPRGMSDSFELVKCDVIAEGAANERDETKKLELFERAMTSYSRFLEQNGYSPERANANSAYVKTAEKYSRALEEALEVALGEEAEALRTRRQEVLEGALTKANEEVSALSGMARRERTQADTIRLFSLYLNKGKMLAELAELFIASGSAGSTFFGDAVGALEELVFEAGEGTPHALLGYIEIGRVYLKQGDPATASDYFSAVIEQTITPDKEAWETLVDEQDLNDADKAQRFRFLERAIGPLMESYLNAGDHAELVRYALHFYNTVKREGFDLGPYGHLSMLEVAGALLETGGFVGGNLTQGEGQWFNTVEEMNAAGFKGRRETTDTTDLALRIAQSTNEANKGNILQLKAQKLISEIITRPGVLVSPEVLLDAAQGEYYDDNFIAALEGYHRVLNAIESQDQATRIAFGGRVMNGIGNCYRKLEEPILAAMAFREGCTTWLGDIEFDAKNANGFYRMIQDVERGAAIDKDIISLIVSEAEGIIATNSVGVSRDEVIYNIGKKAQKKRNWQVAISEYQKIEDGTDWWEKAVVDIAVCRYRDGDAAGALSGFDLYLETFLKDAKRSATESPLRLAKRREASATAEFYRGYINFLGAKSKDDAAGFEKVIVLLTGYADKFGEQPALAAWALNMLVQSHLKGSQLTEAREVMKKLAQTFPDAKHTGQAALIFYNTLLRLQQDSADEEEKVTLLREMAEHLERGNSVGALKFTNLSNESRHWFDLGEWNKCELVTARLLTKFDGDEDREKKLRTILKPRLGKCLLYQGRMAEAKEVLTPLVMDSAHTAPRSTVLAWGESVVGSVDGTGQTVVVSPGAGGTDEEFEFLTKRLNSYAGAGDKWISCDWYAMKFQGVYAYYIWGQQDGRKLDSAKSQLKIIISETGKNFDPIADVCVAGEEESEENLAKYGGGALKACFKWLDRTLN